MKQQVVLIKHFVMKFLEKLDLEQWMKLRHYLVLVKQQLVMQMMKQLELKNLIELLKNFLRSLMLGQLVELMKWMKQQQLLLMMVLMLVQLKDWSLLKQQESQMME